MQTQFALILGNFGKSLYILEFWEIMTPIFIHTLFALILGDFGTYSYINSICANVGPGDFGTYLYANSNCANFGRFWHLFVRKLNLT